MSEVLLPDFIKSNVGCQGTVKKQTGQSNDGNLRHGGDVNVVSDFWAQHAIDKIRATYGDETRMSPTSFLKFGKTFNSDSGSQTTVAIMPDSLLHETFVSTNAIDSISSASTSDVGQPVTIEGHTISGGVFTSASQVISLNGQNRVALTTPLARVQRAYTIDPNGLVAPVYIFENVALTGGVPNVDANVHLIIDSGQVQSRKASSTCSNVEYGIITMMTGSVNRTSTANVDMELQIRPVGEAFRPAYEDSLRSTGGNRFSIDFRPYIIAPKNSDIRVVAASSANNTTVAASYGVINCAVQS